MRKFKLILFIFILLQFIIFSSPSFADSEILETYSPSCILMDAKSGKILYEKNSNEVRYPASTTKIMTAILTVENCNLSDVATVSHNAIYSVPVSYSHASLKEGENLTIEQLLNVLLIPSANDAAFVLAEHISGSVEEFANLMNQKAKEIGCLNTHFVNPNGIHNKDHTSTAYDLALMGKYAMQNNTIREIVSKTTYALPATNKYSKTDRVFNTTNDLIVENNSTAKDNYYYPYAIGIKTGYTTNAGSCIIAAAEKDDIELIVVVLGGESTSSGLSQRYLDCINLFNYGFNNYHTLHEANSILKQISIWGATSETKDLNLVIKDKISIFTNEISDLNNLEPEIILNENLKAPIAANSIVGKISYTFDGQTYSSDLIAETEVVSSNFLPILFRILLIFITIYLLYLLLKPSKKDKNGKKKYDKKKIYNKSKGKGFRFTQLSDLYSLPYDK